MSTPSIETFALNLRSDDLFSVVMRAYQGLDAILGDMISASMSSPDDMNLEIGRLSSSLKIELVVGLGLVRPDDAPILRKVNSLRNRFAHDANAVLTSGDASQLLSCLSARQREMLVNAWGNELEAGDLLRHVLFLVYAMCDATLERKRDLALRVEATIEAANDLLRARGERAPDPAWEQRWRENVAARMEEKRRQRAASSGRGRDSASPEDGEGT